MSGWAYRIALLVRLPGRKPSQLPEIDGPSGWILAEGRQEGSAALKPGEILLSRLSDVGASLVAIGVC